MPSRWVAFWVAQPQAPVGWQGCVSPQHSLAVFVSVRLQTLYANTALSGEASSRRRRFEEAD